MFDTTSKNSKIQKFQRDFDVDSSKSEKRAKKDPIEHQIFQRKALDDQEVGKTKRGFDDQDVGYNKKRQLFDMNAKTSQSPDYNRKKISEPLSAAVFDYKKPDLKKIKTEAKPVVLD